MRGCPKGKNYFSGVASKAAPTLAGMRKARELYDDADRRDRETQIHLAKIQELRLLAVEQGRSDLLKVLGNLERRFVDICERDRATKARLSPLL